MAETNFDLAAALAENENSEDTPRVEHIVDFFPRQANRSVKITWACLSLSSIDAPQKLRFLLELRNTCVDIGMDFKMMPTVNTELYCAIPAGIEKALCDAYELIKKLLDGRRLGLLIVILPEERSYDEKVGDVCKKLGVTYHCCLPQDVYPLRQEYLDSAARKINDKAKEDCDSTELDDEMGEYFDSSSDEVFSSDSDSDEVHCCYDEIYGFDTSGDYRLSSSKTEKEKDLASANDGFFVEHKADMTSEVPASHVLDKYSNYQTLKENEVQVERGIMMYWACVNLACVDDVRLFGFWHKLRTKLMAIGMYFSSLPTKISEVKPAVPADIENTLLGVCNSISELGISLLLVILPEDRDFDAKVEEVCKNLGVGYQCCLPYYVRCPTKLYLKQTAHKIKLKVVKQQAVIPFVSEAPTILLGVDMSSCIGEGSKIVSVAASMQWPKVSRYLVVSCLEENYGSIVSKLLLNCETATKQAPQRMILFRCGVMKGRNQILREIDSINMECRSSSNHKPTLTYVIVTERLIMESEGRNEMTPNGTRVQDTFYPTRFEVLCNHGPFEGPSMPVHYSVVHDENNLTPDLFKSIIIKLSLLRDHDMYPKMPMGLRLGASTRCWIKLWFAASTPSILRW